MKTRNIFILFVLITIFIPQVTFAVWWNPLTWFKKSTKIIQPLPAVSTTTQPTIEELTKKIEELQKQVNSASSTQNEKPDKISKTIEVKVEPKIQETPVTKPAVKDSSMMIAICQAERQSAYNSGFQAFDQKRQQGLSEAKAQIAKYRDDHIAQIYAAADEDKAACTSAPMTPWAVTDCIESSTDQTMSLVNSTIMTTNGMWAERQRDAEKAEQAFNSQISPILDQWYMACLNK